jgi:hypothetical protein
VAPSNFVPFENSSENEKDREELISKNKSLIELPDEKITGRNGTPPERSKTQLKIPKIDLEKVESVSRLEVLAKTDRRKILALEKRKEELELATCTFMPNSSRKGQVGVSKDFVSKMSKPKIKDKYQKIKEERELKNCTFAPKTNKPKRAKTARPKEEV